MHPLKALRALYDNLIGEIQALRQAVKANGTPSVTATVSTPDLAAIREGIDYLVRSEKQKREHAGLRAI